VKRARRIFRWVLFGAVGLAALAALFAAFVLFTTPGAKLALSLANGRDLPVRAQSVEGALGRRFVLYGVELVLGPVQATLDTVIVAWRPLALRDHRVQIIETTIAGGRIVITPGESEAPDSAGTAGTVAAPVTPPDRTEEARWIMMADRLRVRNVSVDAPGNVHLRQVDIAASGGPDAYRAEVRASGSVWRLTEMNAFVRVSGDTRAAAADSLEVRTFDGVVRGNAFMRWDPALSWRSRVHGDSLRAGELAGRPKDFLGAVSFRVASTGRVNEDSTRIGIDVRSLDATLRDRPLSARGRVDIDHGLADAGQSPASERRGRIEASDSEVRWGSARATFSGSMGDVADVRFDATVPVLSEVLPGARGAGSVRGTLAGTPERIEVDVRIQGRDIGAGDIALPSIVGSLDATASAENYVPHAAELRRAEFQFGESRLHTRGTVSWRDGIAWNGVVDAERVETSTLAPAQWHLYGPVSIRASTEGQKRGRSMRGLVAIESLSGRLRDRELAGTGSVAVNNGELDFSALHIAWGDARVTADGHAGKTLDLEYDVVAPNLAAIDSSLHGSVSIRGSASGARKKPRVNADITGDSLRVRTYAARRLEGHVDADLSFASSADVDLLALGVASGETTADTVRVRVAGPREDHRAMLAVAMKDVRAEITLHGSFADTAWSGWIENLRVAQPAAGEWRLHDQAPVFVSRSRVQADSLVLESGDTRLAAHGTWQHGDSTHAEIELKDFALSFFQPFLADSVKITGAANGSAFVSIDPDKGVVARVDLVPGPGEFVMADKKIAYEGRVTGRADETGVFAKLDFDMQQAGVPVATIDADLSIPGFVLGRDSLGTQPLDGGLDVECKNIAPVMAVFAPALPGASGTLSAHLSPVGTAEDFRISGRVALENGRVDLRSGLRLRDTDITLVSDGAGSVSLDGAATSGGGRVVVKATSARSEKAWINGNFTARGERFQVVNQPEAQVFVSPEVDVQVAERVALVTGRVRVPYARIETAEVPASAVSASNEVVFVEDTLATRPTWQVKTQLRVELGDSVTFKGFGLQARLAGSLAIDDERGRPTRGMGEIQIVEGKYRAYGNELTIDPGRFVFGGGPIDNPGLDIRAYRGLTTQNVMAGSGEMVGLNLRGTLRRPEISVFSNPPMSQSEIMSYLVLGRPMSTSGDQSALASAALLVGMQQSGGVTGGIGNALALDEAYIEGGSDIKETSFVAGKYLSPKLYISYATGLFEKTNTFRVRYSLAPRWTLQAENGKDSSTDLLYWFERGK